MHFNIFQTIFLLSTFLAAIGLSVIIYSRNSENITSKLFVLMLLLVAGYIASHTTHFVFYRSGDVTILDMSCHSFLLMILVTLTFFTWNYPTPKKMGVLRSLSILLPSIALLVLLWSNSMVLLSHAHDERFEAHYTKLYPLFLIWYVFLLGLNVIWLVKKIRKEKDPNLRSRAILFIVGLLLTNFISFFFGLFLPWELGFYFLVEISPLTFLVGVILFTAIAVGKYDLFPSALNKVSGFSINRKVFLSALVLVPIIILLLEIPIITIFFEIHTSDELVKLFFISLFGGLLVSVSMSFVILKVISNPIDLLRNKAKEIEKGNYGIKVEFSSNDEIGELTKAFNSMSETLKNNYDEIEQKQNRITLLLNAFDKSSVAIAIVDKEFDIIEVNNTFEELVGKERNDIIAHKIEEIQCKDRKYFNYDLIEKELAVSNRFEGEIRWIGPNDREHYLLLSVTPTSLQSEETDGYLFVEIDITEKKKLEEQLLKSEKLAALGEMAAVLAHEIKTPLTSIKMNADILNEALELNNEDKAAFSIIQKEINRLNNLVKDVLNFSRQTNLVYSKFDLSETISRIKQQVFSKLQEKNAELINRIHPIEINADEEKLTQVLLNMIDNSIDSIGKNGRIIIESDVSNNSIVSINIIDDGGSNLNGDKIFEPFYTSKASGTGLGLSISQKIIQQHGGTISLVASEKDKTAFRIDLPVARPNGKFSEMNIDSHSN
jgi:PAS domain S-box-containing protein